MCVNLPPSCINGLAGLTPSLSCTSNWTHGWQRAFYIETFLQLLLVTKAGWTFFLSQKILWMDIQIPGKCVCEMTCKVLEIQLWAAVRSRRNKAQTLKKKEEIVSYLSVMIWLGATGSRFDFWLSSQKPRKIKPNWLSVQWMILSSLPVNEKNIISLEGQRRKE